MAKRISSIFLSIVLSLTLLTACTSGTKVPDVVGSDQETAKSVIAALGLVPTIEEEVSESVDAGIVIKTVPKSGESLSPGSKISIIVSKGQKRVTSQDSNMEWTFVSYGEDKWEFTNPYIEDGSMFIEFSNVQLMAQVKWKDDQKNGYGFGQASINDTFDKAVPIKILYEDQSHKSGQRQDFVVKIPVSDLNEDKPTTMYLRLFAYINGRDSEINLNLTATW